MKFIILLFCFALISCKGYIKQDQQQKEVLEKYKKSEDPRDPESVKLEKGVLEDEKEKDKETKKSLEYKKRKPDYDDSIENYTDSKSRTHQ